MDGTTLDMLVRFKVVSRRLGIPDIDIGRMSEDRHYCLGVLAATERFGNEDLVALGAGLAKQLGFLAQDPASAGSGADRLRPEQKITLVAVLRTLSAARAQLSRAIQFQKNSSYVYPWRFKRGDATEATSPGAGPQTLGRMRDAGL